MNGLLRQMFMQDGATMANRKKAAKEGECESEVRRNKSCLITVILMISLIRNEWINDHEIVYACPD